MQSLILHSAAARAAWASSRYLAPYAASKVMRRWRGTALREPTSTDRSLIPTPAELSALKEVEKKLIWLSSYMVHHANSIREKKDSLKVGGHQASSTSMVTLLTALYFRGLLPHDRVAVKPHASPVLHSIFYLMGKQTKENMLNFRGFGGVQSYPSITKDKPTDIDYSTGSVGLGAAVTTFSALLQDYLNFKGLRSPLAQPGSRDGRMIALVGDAELDEGNVYEALMESWKLGIRNNMWFIDYNRQSLDKVTENQHFRQIDRMFRGNGWNVVTLKYGKKLNEIFRRPGGHAIKSWLNTCDNSVYCALTYMGGKAFRETMTSEIRDQEALRTIAGYSDTELFETMTHLGGHCLETILEALQEHESVVGSTCFIAYTVKGYGLPLAGHRDNHGLYINQTQMDELQARMGIAKGMEWDPLAGVKDVAAVKALIAKAPINSANMNRRLVAPHVEIPDLTMKKAKEISTQAAFGQVMLEIGRSKTEFASRVITTAPDVTTSTNLIGFVNQRGVFGIQEAYDVFQKKNVPSMNKWGVTHKGQHVPLGIAEHNFFLALTAFGMSAQHFGHRLFPVGTLYDPFIARGLDALNYGCYQDARFMLVATPSGITLSPEGGAHQSINTPLIGMSQPNLTSFEPAYADELKEIMQWGFRHMQAPNGSSVYLRLSTRNLVQLERDMTAELRDAILSGAYWHVPPTDKTKVVIAFTGVVAPEAAQAQKQLNDGPMAGEVALLQVTSPDVLYRDWHALEEQSHAHELMSALPTGARIVSVLDGYPTALTWLGSVRGHRVEGLGVTRFGQCGNIPDLYRNYGIDAEAIVAKCLHARS